MSYDLDPISAASSSGAQIHRLSNFMRFGEAISVEAVSGVGVLEIDGALPWGGLPPGVHEIASPSGDAVGIAFAALLIGRRQGPVLWCRSRHTALTVGEPYGPGMLELGLQPERLILVEAAKSADLLWAMEEGARRQGLAAVLGEGVQADLTCSRRLQLAAEAGHTLVILVSPSASQPASLSAMTRWHVAAAPSMTEAGGPGLPRWKLELMRCRGGGQPRSWIVEWNDAALSLSVVPLFSDRPLAAASA